MSTSLAQMIFPALGVVIADTWGFDAIFIVAAVTAALTILTIARIKEPPTLRPKPILERLAELPAALSALRPRGLPVGLPAAQKGALPKLALPEAPGSLIPRPAVFPMSIFLTVTFSFGAVSAFLPLLSDERDLGNVGLYFLVSGAGAVVTRPIAGSLSDRLGRVPVVVPGLLLSAIGMWILTQADTLPIMLLAGVFGGVGLGAAHTGLLALALDRVRGNQRGGATAVFQIAWDIGGLLGSTALGFVASAIDVEIVFWIASITIFSGVVALLGGRTMGWTAPHRESVAEPLAPARAEV
jgi:MFS family permease